MFSFFGRQRFYSHHPHNGHKVKYKKNKKKLFFTVRVMEPLTDVVGTPTRHSPGQPCAGGLARRPPVVSSNLT